MLRSIVGRCFAMALTMGLFGGIAQAQTNIMVMGDSFACGKNVGGGYMPPIDYKGYRAALFAELNVSGPGGFQFVGTNTFNNDWGFTTHCSARGRGTLHFDDFGLVSSSSVSTPTGVAPVNGPMNNGDWTASLWGWADYPANADVVVFQLGFNDIVYYNFGGNWRSMFEGLAYAQRVVHLFGLLNQHHNNPEIFVCSVPYPESPSTDMADAIDDANVWLAYVAGVYGYQFVDIGSDLDPQEDYEDGTHLKASGDAKVAASIADAILN